MVRSRGLMGASFISTLDARYRRESATLRAVDRMFLHIYQKISGLGALSDTYFIFASDNGWMWGDHRIPAGKGWSYGQVMRNPLVIRGPGIAAGRRIDALVNNADFAPTIAELAGATPSDKVDGRSFAGLLTGSGGWTRKSMPANYLHEASQPQAPTWRGIALDRYAYEYYPDTGEDELYDLVADPYRLSNIAPTSGATVATLRALADQLDACSGAGCRSLEDQPLP
jgi:arylsulfatase A-like enzyme